MADPIEESTPVTEAAKALALAIKNDTRFTDWREVTATFEANDALKGQLARFQELAEQAQFAQHGGPGLNEAEMAEIGNIQKNLQDDILFTRHNKSTGELLELLHSANDAVSAEIGLDFAGNVVATSGE